MSGALGRRPPTTDLHVRTHPLAIEQTVTKVEHVMELPSWHWLHQQFAQGACVGHGTAMERAIRQRFENKYLKKLAKYTVRYDAWWLWDRAKEADEWPDTNPGDENGTSVHAAYDVTRHQGAPKIALSYHSDYPGPDAERREAADPSARVDVNTWATSVDQIRTCIAADQPVTIGVNWYENFDTPYSTRQGWFVGKGDLGKVRGGHCVCLYGASDARQAFRVKNSWGRDYPLVWLPYDAMSRLLGEDGEATVATDSLL